MITVEDRISEADQKALYENGTDAVLIGELLMRKSDRKAALMELKQQTGRQLDMN